MARNGLVAIRSKGFVHHGRTEVAATNSDIDDMADSFSGTSNDFTRSDSTGQISHAIENCVH